MEDTFSTTRYQMNGFVRCGSHMQAFSAINIDLVISKEPIKNFQSVLCGFCAYKFTLPNGFSVNRKACYTQLMHSTKANSLVGRYLNVSPSVIYLSTLSPKVCLLRCWRGRLNPPRDLFACDRKLWCSHIYANQHPSLYLWWWW